MKDTGELFELEKKIAALEKQVQELQEKITQMCDAEDFAKAMCKGLQMQSREVTSNYLPDLNPEITMREVRAWKTHG